MAERGGAGAGAAGAEARRKPKVYGPLEVIQSSRTTGALSGLYHAYGVCGSKKEGYGRYLNDYWREKCDSDDPDQLVEGHSTFLKMLKRCIRLRSRAANTLLEQARMDLLRDLISGHHNELFRWQTFTFMIKQKWESGPHNARQLDWVELEMEDGHGFRVVFSGGKPEKIWPRFGIDFIRTPTQGDIYDSVNGFDLGELIDFELLVTLESDGRLNQQVLRDLGHLRHLNMWKRLYLMVKYTDPRIIEGFTKINTRRQGWSGKNKWDEMIHTALVDIRDNQGDTNHLWELHKILQAYMNEDGVGLEIEVERGGEWVVETRSTVAFPYYRADGGAEAGRGGGGGGRAADRIVLETFHSMYNRDQVYDTVEDHFDERGACNVIYKRFDDIQEEYSGSIGLPGSISGEDFQAALDSNTNARPLPFLLRSFTLQMNLFDDVTWKRMYPSRGIHAFDTNEMHVARSRPSFPCARLENLKQSEPIGYDSRVRLSQCSSYIKLLACCISMLRNVRDFAFALVTSPKFKVNDSFAKPLTRPCEIDGRSIFQIFDCLVNTHQDAAKKKGAKETRMKWNIPRESFHPFNSPARGAGMPAQTAKASDIVDQICSIRWDMTDEDEVEKEHNLRKALLAFDPIKGKEGKTPAEEKIAVRAELAAQELGLTLNGAIREFELRRDRNAIEWSIYDVIRRYQHLEEDCKEAHALEFRRLNLTLMRLRKIEDDLGHFEVLIPSRARRQRNVRTRQFPRELDYDNSSLQEFLLYFYHNSVAAAGAAPAVPLTGGKQSGKQSAKQQSIDDFESILREAAAQATTAGGKKSKKGNKSTEGSAGAGATVEVENLSVRSDSMGLSAPFSSLDIGLRDLNAVQHGFQSLSNLFIRVSLSNREDIDDVIRLLKH